MRRTPIGRAQLERDHPRLAGRLDPPTGGEPPPGVEVRERDDGTRVVSINIHQAVPGGRDLDRSEQQLDALRDVAAYVNVIDPDVVAVQEVNDHYDHRDGVPHQASVLYHLLDADDMAFAPALGHDGHRADDGREYGNAIYTRNGHVIEQAHAVDLPNDRGRIEDRSAGVAVVRSPGGERTTVVNAHLSAGDEASVRQDQLRRLAGIVEQVEQDGAFTYADSITEDDRRARGLAPDVVLVGDLNARRRSSSSVDQLLDGAGLVHASEDGRSTWDRWVGSMPHADAIDHVYRSAGLVADGYVVAEVPADELDPGDDDATPTDHPIVVTDVRSR